jgi:hypothetical protein
MASDGRKLVIVKRGQRAFKITGLTWIVERSFARLGRNRRMSKDYESTVQTSEAMIDLATIRLMLNRLASTEYFSNTLLHLRRLRQHDCEVSGDGQGRSPAVVPEPLPIPTLGTEFEISAEGKVHRVKGAALQRWILKRRGELNGPKGFLFSQRPALD